MTDLRAMIEMLRYQYPHGVCTMAHCACGKPSRGGGKCADCIACDMIDAGAKPEHVQLLRAAFANRREAEYQVQDVIETIMESPQRPVG